LRYAEFHLIRALNEQKPGDDPSQITAAAIDGSEKLRRKKIGRWMRGVLAVIACGVFAVFMQQRTRPDSSATLESAPENGVVTKTVSLACLRPDQAMAIATPYLRDKAAIYTVPDTRVITLRGKVREIRRALSEINKFDASCQLPTPVPTVPATTSPSR
jgi:hypothetical protein